MRPAPLRWLTRLGERGNVALMTAVFAPLILLVGGFAIDYGYASYLNQRLAQATDNAVLASVSQSAATAGGGFSNVAWLQTYGTNVFNSNVSDLPISNVNFTLQVTSNGTGGVNSIGSYSYNYPTFFAGILGISQMPLKSQIKAAANPLKYIDVYILVDVSQSMGIGATLSDMQALYARVVANNNGSGGEPGCVFGCHVKAPGQSMTNEDLAHNFSPRINLRIDAAVSAIQSVIIDAQSQAGTNKNIRIGLYMINRNPNQPGVYVTAVASPSSNYSTLSGQAAAIDLGDNYAAGAGDTDFQYELNAFNSMLPANGSGASAVSPQNYVFLITDGLEDASRGCQNCHPTVPFNKTYCDQLKLKSSVGTIYTTYNAIYKNNDATQGLEGNYSNLVAPYVTFRNAQQHDYTIMTDQMRDNLKACSSDPSSLAFEAQDGPTLNTAMRTLFANTLQNARLTH